MGLDDFFARVVDTGKEFTNAISSGLNDAGSFIAKVVQDDLKDAITSARAIDVTGNAATAKMKSKLMGEAMKALGYSDLADATDPAKKSTLEIAGAVGNTALNAASFVPGLGQGVKAAQTAAKSSKYMKGGAKLLHEGSKVRGESLVDLKTANTLLQKSADMIVPKSTKKKIESAIADESLELLKDFKGDADKVRRLLGKKGINLTENFGDPAKSQFLKVIKNFGGNPEAAQIMRRAANVGLRQADFLKHVGKVTANKGLRLGVDAVKHGYKAGSKQFLSHSANLWRKSGKDSDTSETSAPVGKYEYTPGKSSRNRKKKKNKKQY